MLTQTTSVVPRNVYRLVSSDRTARGLLPLTTRPARTPPSTFLFLPIHLSNSPEIVRSPSPEFPESRRSPKPPTEIGRLVTTIVRCFAGAPSRRKASGAPLWGYIVGGSHHCQLPQKRNSRRLFSCGKRALPLSRRRSVTTLNAALAPHSSRVVRVGVRPVFTVRIMSSGRAR